MSLHSLVLSLGIRFYYNNNNNNNNDNNIDNNNNNNNLWLTAPKGVTPVN